MKETIYDYNDLLEMLDSLLREPTEFWNNFYSDRNKGVPFFIDSPDENLVSYFEKNVFKPGKVLELGSGPGRNAIYFAQKGCTIDAVDLSEETLKWAEERANYKNVSINFINENIFDLNIEEGTYDIVYDSGCFHHVAPHRRMNYIDIVKRALKPNGFFAITCFIEGGELGGAEISDWEVYRLRSLNGGLGYTEEKLRLIFRDFKEIEIRKMKVIEQPNVVFGVPDFLTALFQKN
ncbi:MULTISPECIES: class I SAM-dependent methyltransferase [unclassified Lysinibacillus]|uniref:class I SAM-dependent methyltransferase n=1 Tax=unclassified Lysinibacillus TaxID=2636778 RepID=UPI0020118836|nr:MULTISPECIES: class I SAM-dependent methyltransferase [unclassified Lysinibacillus]MCL1696622.1 class I SAM-dependent methyltransferase [Lysinibacillus sp. BPa_S21]MCL1698894.1 class I SAM-dependent methyltransferase [Lysinibacillus sp. Bpr_S20]